MKLRVSEIFGPVLQGEGYFVGTPSIFLRLFGCNLRCKKFGIASSEDTSKTDRTIQRLIEELPRYQTLQELLQLTTGCDTFYAIYPEFSKFSQDYTPEQLSEVLNKKVSEKKNNGKRRYHLVITGGEPLLWQKQLIQLLPKLDTKLYSTITFETNSTQILSDDFITCLNELEFKVLFSCSPKLSGSGHSKNETFNPDALHSYNKVKDSYLTLKFVVGKTQPINEIIEFVKGYWIQDIDMGEVYLMPEGCTFSEEYRENCRRVDKLCNEYGLSYSPRLQVEIWNNGVGT